MRRLFTLILMMAIAAGVAILLMRTVARTEVTDLFTAPAPIADVAIDVDTGGVTVDGGADSALTARITRGYAFWGPEITTVASAGKVTMTADCPLLGVISACSADFDVVAPAGVTVNAKSTAGSVMVTGIAGPVTAASTAGGVAVLRSKASTVSATSTAGDVRVETITVPSLVTASTSAGSVDVEVPRGAYRIDASATAGSVNLNGVTRDQGSSKVIRASATAGDVSITGR